MGPVGIKKIGLRKIYGKYLSNQGGDFYSVSRQVIGLPIVGLVNQVANENYNLQCSQEFRRFCTRRCHYAREKLDAWLGARTNKWLSLAPVPRDKPSALNSL
jgi:hypothetical protein